MDAKGRFLSESEIDKSNCQIHMQNHYLKFEIEFNYCRVLYLSLSLELDSPRVKSPNNVYLFLLLTTLFVLSFVVSSKNKNIFAGLHASWKCQLCNDQAGGKIQMTKCKIVKQNNCLAIKILPIFLWLYLTFMKIGLNVMKSKVLTFVCNFN